jgi:hypothetical protein
MVRTLCQLFAERSPQSTSGTGTQCGTSGLASGSSADRFTCSGAGRATRCTTHDGPCLSLPLGGDGRTRPAAHSATDHSAGVPAKLLPDGSSGATAERAAECGLAAAVTRYCGCHCEAAAYRDNHKHSAFHRIRSSNAY